LQLSNFFVYKTFLNKNKILESFSKNIKHTLFLTNIFLIMREELNYMCDLLIYNYNQNYK